MRPQYFVGCLLLWPACDCPPPPSLEFIAASRSDVQIPCDVVYPYASVQWRVGSEAEDGDAIDHWEWELPEGTAVNGPVGSSITAYIGRTSGEYCATAEMSCGDRSNRLCRTLTVVDPPVAVNVAWADGEAANRVASIGAVVDGGYHGHGTDSSNLRDWWSWSWDSLSWTRRADFPRGPTPADVAFALDGRLHVVAADHHVYDPATDAWSAMGPVPLGTVGLWPLVFDGVAYVGFQGTLLYAYDPSTDTWNDTLMPAPIEPVSAFEHMGEAHLFDATGGYLVGTPSTGWTPGDFSGCPLDNVHGAASTGDRIVVVGTGVSATWCELGPSGWKTHAQPAADDCSFSRGYASAPNAVMWGFEDRVAYLGNRALGVVLLGPP